MLHFPILLENRGKAPRVRGPGLTFLSLLLQTVHPGQT